MKRITVYITAKLEELKFGDWEELTSCGERLILTESLLMDAQEVIIIEILKDAMISLKKYWDKERWLDLEEHLNEPTETDIRGR